MARDAAGAEAKEHAEALGEVLKAPAPDTGAARRHFQAAHMARGNAQWVMLRAAAQAKAVLTEAQRGRVEGWMDERERAKAGKPESPEAMGMMGGMGMMEMDMKKCPMMHDGMHGGPSQP